MADPKLAIAIENNRATERFAYEWNTNVRNMALLGHCLWFWWLCDNIINGTNKFFKWIILGSKDEYKALAKQKSKKELKEMLNWLNLHMK